MKMDDNWEEALSEAEIKSNERIKALRGTLLLNLKDRLGGDTTRGDCTKILEGFAQLSEQQSDQLVQFFTVLPQLVQQLNVQPPQAAPAALGAAGPAPQPPAADADEHRRVLAQNALLQDLIDRMLGVVGIGATKISSERDVNVTLTGFTQEVKSLKDKASAAPAPAPQSQLGIQPARLKEKLQAAAKELQPSPDTFSKLNGASKRKEIMDAQSKVLTDLAEQIKLN